MFECVFSFLLLISNYQKIYEIKRFKKNWSYFDHVRLSVCVWRRKTKKATHILTIIIITMRFIWNIESSAKTEVYSQRLLIQSSVQRTESRRRIFSWILDADETCCASAVWARLIENDSVNLFSRSKYLIYFFKNRKMVSGYFRLQL